MSNSSLSYVLKAKTDTENPGILMQAGIDSSSAEMTIYVLNYNPDDKHLKIDPGKWHISAAPATMRSLYAAGPLSSNTVSYPGEIKSINRSVAIGKSGKPSFVVPAWSVNEIRLSLKGK